MAFTIDAESETEVCFSMFLHIDFLRGRYFLGLVSILQQRFRYIYIYTEKDSNCVNFSYF